MEPSGSNKGFFQQQPGLKNAFYDDVSYQRILKLFVPPSLLEQVEPDLAQIGDDVISSRIFNYVTDAERNLPYIRGSGRDAFGKQTNELVTGEGWRKLQEFGQEKGFVAYNYDTNHAQYTRLIQMLRLHLWTGSNAMTDCPGAMTDGAARLLQRHLLSQPSTLDPTLRRVLQNAFDHITSRDPARAWTSGQWMTERVGGSDVSQSETVATYMTHPSPAAVASAEEGMPLGPWSISGFKFFSSATDANMTILLARTSPDKGVSAFFAPMRRAVDGGVGGEEMNGVRIQRLKDKLGTRPVPTAELELEGMRGWLIGQEGRGVQEISHILTTTRMHCAVGCLGSIGRGLGVAKSYALVREVGAGKGARVPLCRSRLHMRTLADMTTEYHGLMLLLFLTVYIVGLEENASNGRDTAKEVSPFVKAVTPPPKLVAPLLRVLSSLHKGYICKQSVPLLYACMESLGGVGYLLNSESEHMNIARLFRDGCVNAIWEGTTDVISTDMLRAMKHPASGKESIEAVDWFIKSSVNSSKSDTGAGQLLERWNILKKRIETQSQETLISEARDFMFSLAEVFVATLMVLDSQQGEAPEIKVMCRRFLVRKGFLQPQREVTEAETLETDVRIVYRDDTPRPTAAKI